jgi:hypothetical protein
MGNAAHKGKGAVTGKDIRTYQDQTNFSKVELKKVIAAFDKEANKVRAGGSAASFFPNSRFFAKDGVLDRDAWKRVLGE